MALTTSEFTKIFNRDLSLETDPTVAGVKNIRNGPCTLYSLGMNNTNASHAFASLKVYDEDGDGWVAGTTQPVMVIPCPDNVHTDVDITEGLELTEGLTIAAATEDGTVCTTNPAGDLGTSIITA